MAENGTGSPLPPAYESVVHSGIYTISYPGAADVESREQPAPDHPVPAATPAAAPTRATTPARVIWNQMNQLVSLPPSYESLFGGRRGKVVAAPAPSSPAPSSPAPSSPARTADDPTAAVQPAQQTERVRVNETHVDSEARNTDGPGSNSLPCNWCAVATDNNERLRELPRHTAWCILCVSLVVSIALVCVASSYKTCPASKNLSSCLVLSGVAGSAFALWTIVALISISKGREVCAKGLYALFPLVLIVLFFIGSSTAYKVWLEKACDPFAGECIELYCDDTLMIVGLTFYASSTVLLTPLWILIIYTILKYIWGLLDKIREM